ncbi:MAG TPA: apolipoprotein N-acyltransferase, partial [Isosphaeraceae bacterium]
MATRTSIATDARVSRPSPAPEPPGSHPAVLAVASALLLFCAFPPAGWGWLAWVAPTPLFLLVRSDRSRRSVYLGAWLGGLVFWLLALAWITRSDEGAWLAWIVMATALSAWWPAFLLLARLAVRRLRLPLMVAAPVAWVTLEFVRAYAVTGFPWYYLAHTQYRVLPLIQIADLTGAWGLSFLMAMAAACWADLRTFPVLEPSPRGPRPARAQAVRLGVLAVAVGATVAYGVGRVATSRPRPGPRVALLQSNFRQEYKMSSDAEQIVGVYRGLIERALRDGTPPDLVVWPETSYPYGYAERDAALDDAGFERQVRSISREAKVEIWRANLRNVPQILHDWADQMGVPMLVGSASYHFRVDGLTRYNSALLFEPGTAAVQSYHKLHLV